jgi:hypothetical protein
MDVVHLTLLLSPGAVAKTTVVETIYKPSCEFERPEPGLAHVSFREDTVSAGSFVARRRCEASSARPLNARVASVTASMLTPRRTLVLCPGSASECSELFI